jgi:hypothetical protein
MNPPSDLAWLEMLVLDYGVKCATGRKAHDEHTKLIAAIRQLWNENTVLRKRAIELQQAILADGDECDHEWSGCGLDEPIECVKCGDAQLADGGTDDFCKHGIPRSKGCGQCVAGW